jgi:hypothetical protein
MPLEATSTLVGTEDVKDYPRSNLARCSGACTYYTRRQSDGRWYLFPYEIQIARHDYALRSAHRRLNERANVHTVLFAYNNLTYCCTELQALHLGPYTDGTHAHWHCTYHNAASPSLFPICPHRLFVDRSNTDNDSIIAVLDNFVQINRGVMHDQFYLFNILAATEFLRDASKISAFEPKFLSFLPFILFLGLCDHLEVWQRPEWCVTSTKVRDRQGGAWHVTADLNEIVQYTSATL